MHIYVRRGGPNYQKGLAKMRMLGEEIGIPIEVTSPLLSLSMIEEAYIWDINALPLCFTFVTFVPNT